MGTALVVVAMLAVLPAVAEAQSIAAATSQEAHEADANAAAHSVVVVVVAPGDSLWSISAERLGAGATPQQVTKGAQQIYALNRDQIGPDPSLIFVGQRLSVPAMGSAEAPRADAPRAEAPRVDAPRPDAKPTPPAAREGAATTTTTAAAAAASRPKGGHAESATRTEKAPSLGSEKPSLPNVADAAPAVPAARQVASEDSPTNGSPLAPLLGDVRSVATSAASAVDENLAAVRAAADDRRTLGWTILALTAFVGVLMAWRLPMKRTTRSDVERWGIPTGYYGGGSYASYWGNPDVPTAKPVEESRERLAEQLTPAGVALAALEPSTNGSKANGSKANAARTDAPPNGGIQAARRREIA